MESKSITSNLFTVISSSYCKGVDVVGWETNSKTLTTIDVENNVISTKEILPTFDRKASYCGKKDGYSFPENNLLEVYRIRFSEEGYPGYDKMTSFFYYRIKDSGEIEELRSPRIFDCSKCAILNEQHFQGCFVRERREEENTDSVPHEGNLLLSRHLSIEDLDFMIQEIYAEYGLSFNEVKWKEYFSKKDWYKAKSENVDQLLSLTDKMNIQFVKEMQEKMRGKELEYTDRKWVEYIDMD